MHKYNILFIFALTLSSLFIFILSSTSVAQEYYISSVPGQINNCTTLNVSGVYTLNTSVSNFGATCFNITSSNIYLRGINDSIIIDGDDSGTNYGIFVINATNITLANLTITDFSSGGIFLNYTNKSLITNISLSSNGYGIYVQFSHHNNIFNVTTESNTFTGIYVTQSRNITIVKEKSITDGDDGIVFSSVNQSFIFNSTSTGGGGNGQGIQLTSSYFNVLEGNRATNIDGAYLIQTSSNYNNLTNNTGSSDGGVLSITSSNFNRISNNTLTGSLAGSSISITGDNNSISYNNLSSSLVGATISGVNNNLTGNNIFETSDTAVTLGSNSFMYKNVIKGAAGTSGIVLGANNTLIDITIQSSIRGIDINNRNNIIKNSFINNTTQDAISVNQLAENNTLENLTIRSANSTQRDLFLSAGTNNTIISDSLINSYNFSNTGATMELRNTSYGIIHFTGLLSAQGSNLSSDMNISDNAIYVNSSKTGLDKAANLTLYNIQSYSSPVILKDGATCAASICTLQTGTSGNVTFLVTSFSTYSMGSNPGAGGSSGGGGGGGGGTITPPIEHPPEENVTLDPSSCADSDGGKNYGFKGIVSKTDSLSQVSTFADSCTNSTTLLEYSCSNFQEAFEQYSCLGICNEGKCESVAQKQNDTLPLIIGDKLINILGGSSAGSASGGAGELNKFCGVYSIISPESASASSTNGDFKASNAIDNNFDSRWHGDAKEDYPKWIVLDIGEEKCIKSLDLFIYQWDIPLTADIQVSNDKKTWITVISNITINNPRTIALSIPQIVVARYVRIYETSGKRPFGSLSEIRLHAANYTSNIKERKSILITSYSETPFKAYSSSGEILFEGLSNSSSTINLDLNSLAKLEFTCNS